MKNYFLSLPLIGMSLLCAACGSVKPVEQYYIQDLAKNQQKIILNSENSYTLTTQENDLWRLLKETGLGKEYPGLLSKYSNIFRRFSCKLDSDGNFGWKFTKQDSLLNAARVIRDLRAPRRKKAFAQKLIEIWNSGDDYTAQMLYEQALRESVPSCCLIREKHTDSDEAYSPAAIREGYYTVEKETGKEIFVRHGLSREFAVNGCFVHESFWEHGKMTKNIMTLKGYSAN